MSDLRIPQNPGIGGLDELTNTEELLVGDLNSITQAKGTIIISDGVNFVGLTLGTNTHVLTADSTQSTGIKWAATGGVVPSFADEETPTGDVNGSNTEFTLANTPSPASSLQFVVNGQVLTSGGEDFTLATATVTTVTAPPTGSVIRVWYRY